MNWTFNRLQGLITVVTHVRGPRDTMFARLVLDTGASKTVLTPNLLALVGVDPIDVVERSRMATMNGVVHVPSYRVAEVHAFGLTARDFTVHAAEVPLGEAIDGLLGLDFRDGTIEVE